MHHFFWEVPFGAKGNEEESPLALKEVVSVVILHENY